MVRWLTIILLVSTGCATMPLGPSVTVLPGRGRTYEEFRRDETFCKEMAVQQMAESPEALQAKATAQSAVVTGLIGAAAGAAIGAVTGSAGRGAAIGGATGGVLGAAGGSGAGQRAAQQVQMRYDQAYVACMYSYNHAIPSMPTMSR